jgi:hypothetical protein
MADFTMVIHVRRIIFATLALVCFIPPPVSTAQRPEATIMPGPVPPDIGDALAQFGREAEETVDGFLTTLEPVSSWRANRRLVQFVEQRLGKKEDVP